MNDDQLAALQDGFETYDLLDTVGLVDALRRELGDDADGRPPELRMDLLKLHQLAMDVVNEGRDRKATEMFDLADDLSFQVFELKQKLERIEDTLDRLLEFRPEFDDDENEEG